MDKFLLLTGMVKFADVAFLLVRLLIGTFLMWGVWDNIANPERMAEFAGFLMQFKFPYPALMAPLSVWVQFLCGLGIALGLFARWSGLFCAVNFVIAVAMVDIHGGIRQAFPAAMLVGFGLYLLARGAGKYSFDTVLESRLAGSSSR